MNLRGNEQELARLGPYGLVEKLETNSMEAIVIVNRRLALSNIMQLLAFIMGTIVSIRRK